MFLRIVWHTVAATLCLIVAVVAFGLIMPAFLVWFACWVDRDNIRADLQLIRSRRLLNQHIKAMTHG